MPNITFEIRKKIEELAPSCRSKRELARKLNIPYSTLTNEFIRNSVNGKYNAESAEELALIRLQHKYCRKPDSPDTVLSLFISLKNQVEVLQSHLNIIMEHLKI